jgi:hypothetical protein
MKEAITGMLGEKPEEMKVEVTMDEILFVQNLLRKIGTTAEKVDYNSDWSSLAHELTSSNLSLEEKLAKLDQSIAEDRAKLPPEIEKKTLDEKYSDFLSKIAEHNNLNYEVVSNNESILLKYGNDSVLMEVRTNARVGERSPISFYLVVSPEDATKTWFQEMVNEIGGDVRVDGAQSYLNDIF